MSLSAPFSTRTILKPATRCLKDSQELVRYLRIEALLNGYSFNVFAVTLQSAPRKRASEPLAAFLELQDGRPSSHCPIFVTLRKDKYLQLQNHYLKYSAAGRSRAR